MVKHLFAVTLDKENVDRVKQLIEKNGGKLSAVIDQMIISWLDENDPEKKYLNKIKRK